MSFAPPPPPAAGPTVRTPVWAWAFPALGVLAAIGAVLPWFRPTVSGLGQSLQADDSIHSWNDGRIGLVGPVVMLVVGIGWAIALIKKSDPRIGRGRSSANPLQSAAKTSIIAGALGVAGVIAAWFLVPHNYKDWDRIEQQVKAQGLSLGRGPEIGYWLVAASSVLFLVLGIIAFLQTRDTSPAATGPAFGTPGYGAPPAQGYGPPPGGFAPPAQGYAPTPQGYAPQPQGYGPPPGGFTPPPQGYADQPAPAQAQPWTPSLSKDEPDSDATQVRPAIPQWGPPPAAPQ